MQQWIQSSCADVVTMPPQLVNAVNPRGLGGTGGDTIPPTVSVAPPGNIAGAIAFNFSEPVVNITLDDVVEHGLPWVAGRFQRLLGGAIYVSIDIDVLDPAFAPASCPNPGGLTSISGRT